MMLDLPAGAELQSELYKSFSEHLLNDLERTQAGCLLALTPGEFAEVIRKSPRRDRAPSRGGGDDLLQYQLGGGGLYQLP